MHFFLSWAATHHSFTFNMRILYELKYKLCLCKIVFGIFHFRFCFVFIKVHIFVQQRAWTLALWKVIIPFKIKIIEKPYLIFKLQQEVWKFRDIFVNLSSPKTHLEKNFLNLENQSFEYVTFSQQYFLIKYLTFLFLLTYLFLLIIYLFL